MSYENSGDSHVFHVLGLLAALVALGLFVYGLFKVQQKIGIVFGGSSQPR